MSTFSFQLKVVIIGGGIHGSSLAYFLTNKGVKPLVLERSSVASAASGKSGGFLARDWGSGPTIPLHKISYGLHAKLAHDLEINSYREISTISVNGNRKGSSPASWLDGKLIAHSMGEGTAQVDPKELTDKLMTTAISQGAELKIAYVKNIEIQNSKVTGVILSDGQIIPADMVILTMGPWTGPYAEDWFGMTLPMDGIKSTSILYKNQEIIKAQPYACFCDDDPQGCHLEIYPRPNGDVYICGIGGSDYVNGDRLRPGGDCESPEVIHADPSRVTAAVASVSALSSALGSQQPDIVQACMRPCCPDGLPVMGPVPNIEGAFISAGHNCWGILWAPVSGFCMSELIVDGASTTVDLSPFRPDRFMAPKRGTRGRKAGEVEVGEQW